jgi:hypothetical protein
MEPSFLNTIAMCIPVETLKLALTHSLAFTRLVAFQSLEAVVASYSQSVEQEAELWQFAFPYAVKTTESEEYTQSLLQCLSVFMDRFSTYEVALWDKATTEQSNQRKRDSSGELIASDAAGILLRLHSFFVRFLINDVVLKKGAYPGTVADKEGFSLTLLECLLTFVTQDQSYSSDNCVARNGKWDQRRRAPVEVRTMRQILSALLDREIFAALFALLHSVWDNTRAVAFRFLTKLVIAGQSQNVELPIEYSSDENRKFMQARAIYLASSPRQREADTGARMLAFLYISLPSGEERSSYLAHLLGRLEYRLSAMADALGSVLSGAPCTNSTKDGRDLPLAHGIIHATRLAIEHNRTMRKHRCKSSGDVNDGLYKRMIGEFCKAIQLSLAVVADVREGEVVDGVDADVLVGTSEALNKTGTSATTPLNVNTGAIGANGTVSSFKSTDGQESDRRLAVQRVVVSALSHQ